MTAFTGLPTAKELKELYTQHRCTAASLFFIDKTHAYNQAPEVVPFYADFESLLLPEDVDTLTSLQEALYDKFSPFGYEIDIDETRMSLNMHW